MNDSKHLMSVSRITRTAYVCQMLVDFSNPLLFRGKNCRRSRNKIYHLTVNY